MKPKKKGKGKVSSRIQGQGPADGKISRVEAILARILEIPSTIIFKNALLIILCFAAYGLWSVSTRQYSPVVQKIHVEGKNWKSISSFTMDAGLYYTGVEDTASTYGLQYLHLTTSACGLPITTTVPEAVTQKFPDRYTHLASASLTVSGEDFQADIPYDEWGDWSGRTTVSGPSRLVRSDGGHSLTLENYQKDTSAFLEFFITGRDIFSDVTSSNPYIAYNITFDGFYLEEDASGWLNFYYSRDTSLWNYSRHFAAPLNIVSVYPEPDIVTPTSFSFETHAREILQNGLYVIMEDLSMKRQNERELFFCSVFLGVVASFIVQLFFSLLKDIRDDERRKRLSAKQ